MAFDILNLIKFMRGVNTLALYDNVVICFGDSITEGMGMKRPDAYPGVLGKYLEGQFTVLNAGVGGENSYTICSRANALPFTVTNEVVFEKGEYEYTSDYKIFSGINGEKICYRYACMGRELPISSLIIGGKKYSLRCDRVGKEEYDKYVLKRENADEREIIPVGTLIEYDYSEIYNYCYCSILLQGANDGDMPIDIIIDRYKKIEALNDRFIALIPHYRDDETAELFNESFPNKCVDLREYCKEQFWIDYNIQKNQADIYCINEGILSRRFTYKNNYRDCHLNELGYKILADLIYKKGIELGYWK